MDKFESHATGLNSPAPNAFTVVPDDATDLAISTRFINVAVAGTVKVDTVRGDTVTLFIAAGIAFPVRAQRVYAIGTSATGISGLY